MKSDVEGMFAKIQDQVKALGEEVAGQRDLWKDATDSFYTAQMTALAPIHVMLDGDAVRSQLAGNIGMSMSAGILKSQNDLMNAQSKIEAMMEVIT